MAADIKISYFNMQALAEPTRMLLKYGGIDFTDERFEDEDWPIYKPFMPFTQVPVMEENGKIAHQSVAIARYVAKKVKLVGETIWENMEIDAIVETFLDFKAKIVQYHYQQNPAIKELLREPLFKETIPFYLEKFEEVAKVNNGHFALNKLTWADFYFVGILNFLNYMTQTNLIKDYPNLSKVVENVTSIPNVKAWIDSRPHTEK